MSIFNEITEVKELETEATQEYNELLNRKLFEELTINTPQILLTLSDEPNDVPKEEIGSNREETDGLFAEENSEKDMIRIMILTPDNHSKMSVDVSRDEKKLFAQPVMPETYSKLQKLVIDPDIAIMNTKTKLKNAI